MAAKRHKSRRLLATLAPLRGLLCGVRNFSAICPEVATENSIPTWSPVCSRYWRRSGHPLRAAADPLRVRMNHYTFATSTTARDSSCTVCASRVPDGRLRRQAAAGQECPQGQPARQRLRQSAGARADNEHELPEHPACRVAPIAGQGFIGVTGSRRSGNTRGLIVAPRRAFAAGRMPAARRGAVEGRTTPLPTVRGGA
jgi:hypothetical protein